MMSNAGDRGSTPAYILLGLALLVGVAVVGYAIAGSTGDSAIPHSTDEPGFVVDLEENGDATVVVTHTFDLDDDARAQAFEDLRESETEREEFRQRFESRMSDVADDASVATDREMSISDADIELETVEGTGIVRLSVNWNGLAAASDDSLVVTEPFASDFTSDRPFHVVIPDSHEVSTVMPAPAEQHDTYLTWATGADLDGFELIVSPAEAADDGAVDSDDDSVGDSGGDDGAEGSNDTVDEEGTDGSEGADGDADDDGSGFGVVVAALGLLAALFVLSRQS